jgi:NAD(P)-dependent dehydrogenase (short-subunit alcohol dehydrogenase family)
VTFPSLIDVPLAKSEFPLKKASGIGLAVAQALASRGGWQIHILDTNEDKGNKTASALHDTYFHRTDVTKYDEIATAFKAAFTKGDGRLDFVFANAGVIERSNIYEATSTSFDVPPEPDYTTVEINLKGCMNTAHIARHFIAKGPNEGSIVMTGSCASIWPSYSTPIYTATKRRGLSFVLPTAKSR